LPIPLIIVGAILLFIAALLALRVRIRIVLQNDISVTLHILCFRKRLFPRRKTPKRKYLSKKRAAKNARKAAKKAAKDAAKAAKKKKHLFSKKKKRTLAEKLVLVRAISAALIRKTRKHLRLHAARLHVRVATGDAATTAVSYGVVCQSLSYLLALFDRVTKLKAVTPDVSVTADYLAEKPCADVDIVFSLRVLGALSIVFGAAIAFIRTKIKRNNHKKQAALKAAGAKAQKGNRHG
jgi:hypothetical protein